MLYDIKKKIRDKYLPMGKIIPACCAPIIMGLLFLYLTGVLDAKNMNEVFKCIKGDDGVGVLGGFFFFGLGIWSSSKTLINIIPTPQKEILYFCENKNKEKIFIDQKGRCIDYDEDSSDLHEGYYYVIRTRDYIGEVLEETHASWKPIVIRRFWLTWYSPMGNFENCPFVVIPYFWLLLGMRDFVFGSVAVSIKSVIETLPALAFVAYDLYYKYRYKKYGEAGINNKTSSNDTVNDESNQCEINIDSANDVNLRDENDGTSKLNNVYDYSSDNENIEINTNDMYSVDCSRFDDESYAQKFHAGKNPLRKNDDRLNQREIIFDNTYSFNSNGDSIYKTKNVHSYNVDNGNLKINNVNMHDDSSRFDTEIDLNEIEDIDCDENKKKRLFDPMWISIVNMASLFGCMGIAFLRCIITNPDGGEHALDAVTTGIIIVAVLIIPGIIAWIFFIRKTIINYREIKEDKIIEKFYNDENPVEDNDENPVEDNDGEMNEEISKIENTYKTSEKIKSIIQLLAIVAFIVLVLSISTFANIFVEIWFFYLVGFVICIGIQDVFRKFGHVDIADILLKVVVGIFIAVPLVLMLIGIICLLFDGADFEIVLVVMILAFDLAGAFYETIIKEK